MWRAVTNETLQDIAYVGNIFWEIGTAAILLAAVPFWISDHGIGFRRARVLSTIGLLMALALFFRRFHRHRH